MSDFYTNLVLLGDDILYRGYEDGQPVQYREKSQPVLFFVPQSQSKPSKYKTLDGRKAYPKQFDGAREARDTLKQYEGAAGLEVHGYERFIYQHIGQKFPGEIDYDMSKMKIYTIDIEVACENGFPDVEACQEEMLCITIKDFNTKKIITWGTREYNSEHEYRVFWKEHEMLEDFVQWWAQNTPDIITGWNCNLYDIPYICRRVERVLGEKWKKALSPWKMVRDREIIIRGRKNLAYNVVGVNILDYLDLYQKFTYTNQESYRLDHIAHVELDDAKLDHSEYENFKDFYTKDWQKFIDYNIKDVELVLQLEEKMKLLELAVALAYDAKVNLKDVYYQVRMWDTLIYNFLRQRNIVVPPAKRSNKDEKYAGAYVKEPIPGKYEWVVSFDLNSLYPHLIMQYNISPETLWESRHPSASVDRLLSKTDRIDPKFATCANGAQYRKDIHGFLPEMMQKIYDERVQSKKLMLIAKQEYEKTPTKELEKSISKYNNIQMARKIQLNSAYGAIGNQYFRYYNLRNAEAITLSGQVSIRWIENKVNGYLNKLLNSNEKDYVIASDTDSIYICLDDLVTKVYGDKEVGQEKVVDFLDKACKEKIEPFIDRSYTELAEYTNAYEQKMFMKRENIAARGIWTAKKRYILNVWDSEGVRYNKPKLKMMGIEAVKSSTPMPCRKAIKDALNIMMTGEQDELTTFIDNFKEEFYSLPPEDIAFPRSVNGLRKFKSDTDVYSKGCPLHVRGSLLYNFYVSQKELENKYPLIQEGEKIKYIYMKVGRTNYTGENVLSFLNTFPRELGLEECIDHKISFKKSFLDPLQIITNVIGWETERKANLDFLFA